MGLLKQDSQQVKSIALLLCLTLVAGTAYAGDAEGTVGEVWASPTSNYVMFSINDPTAKAHRCNTSGRYAIDTHAPGGRVTLDVLLLAKHTEQTLFVKSLNTCNLFDAENARYIVIR